MTPSDPHTGLALCSEQSTDEQRCEECAEPRRCADEGCNSRYGQVFKISLSLSHPFASVAMDTPPFPASWLQAVWQIPIGAAKVSWAVDQSGSCRHYAERPKLAGIEYAIDRGHFFSNCYSNILKPVRHDVRARYPMPVWHSLYVKWLAAHCSRRK